MISTHRKILLIGGDAALSVAIGSVFVGRAIHLSIAEAMDPDALEAAARDADVIVAVPSSSNDDPAKILRMIRFCSLQRGTVVIGESGGGGEGAGHGQREREATPSHDSESRV